MVTVRLSGHGGDVDGSHNDTDQTVLAWRSSPPPPRAHG